MNPWTRELQVAVEAARRAGELALQSQRGIEAETKAGLSPVTAADRECERLISEILMDAFPDDGLLGEEGAQRTSGNGRRWIIDPIDGTRDYVRGNPLWATLIGLQSHGQVVVGVASLPGLGRMYTACRGAGAWLNGERLCVSSKTELGDSVLCFNGLNKLGRASFKAQVIDWLQQFWAVRSLGGAFDAMLIASGQADAWIEPTAAPWDLAALQVIVEEAGGVFFNLDGGSSIYGGNAVACTPGLVGAMRECIATFASATPGSSVPPRQ